MNLESASPTYREATLMDVPSLARLDRECFEHHAYSPELISRFLELGQACYLTEDPQDASLVGFAMMMPEPDEDLGVLVTLDVDPAWRRRGVGRALVGLCARRMMDLRPPIATMYLTVASRNDDARAFYHALGFLEADGIPRYYRDDDAVIMLHLDMESLAGMAPPLFGKDGGGRV
jgi:ribosomal protein S18 acetylase RimI-like enzyme